MPFGAARRIVNAVALARGFPGFGEQVMGKILLNLAGTVT